MSYITTPDASVATLDSPTLGSAEPPHAYCWPVWRFGRVLEPRGGQALTVEAAQEVGTLFEPAAPSMERYLTERRDVLRLLVERSGGEVLEKWPAGLKRSPAIQALQKIWRPKESLITYSFVPIIRLPNMLVTLGEGLLWEFRESLTICGYPAKSKIWLTASLVAYRGLPTDESALTREQVDAARAELSNLMSEALDTLMDYYLKVLNDDTELLVPQLSIRFDGFDRLAETEIVGVAASIDLTEIFNSLEELGLTQLRNREREMPRLGSREILDFLDWTDQLEGFSDGRSLERGRPKLLSIYADQPSCGSVRALVIPRLLSKENRTWYTALTELKLTEDQDRLEGMIPLSESACRYTAREFGRFF
jgi:hypothetical protein